MGMFNWFKTHQQLDKEWIENRGLPTPTRTIPMPKCKKPIKDISEPATTLIDMIESGEWDLLPYKNGDGCISLKHQNIVFRNNDQIKLVIYGSFNYDLEPSYKMYLSWTTDDEREAINKALTVGVCQREEEIRIATKLADRLAFSKLLEKETDEKLLS